MARGGLEPLYEQVRGLIEANDQILIFGHKDADGDTLGCSLAFAEALRSQGKTVWVVIPPPLPAMYRWLPGFDQIVERPPDTADPGLVLFFDAGSIERSGGEVRNIASHATVVNVDHHATNTMFGDINIIDVDASAVGQTVLDMFETYGWDVTPGMASNLYVALMTDTGGFRHENTNAEALDTATRLARLGADPGSLAARVYKSRPLTTLRLNALSLAALKIEEEGRLAWTMVTRAMLREAAASMAESEGIIDSLNSIAGLELAIIFKEVGARLTKISVRARGSIDAAALTGRFGGGGHLRAAGAELQMPMDEAVGAVLSAARQELAGG